MNNNITETFKEAENLIHTLKNTSESSILLSTSTVDIMKQTFKIKEAAVIKVHISKEGEPRKISTPEENSRNVYRTKMEDGKQLTSNTYKGLIEKLYDYYEKKCGFITDFSFGNIWLLAQEEYERKHPDSSGTNKSHRQDYKRYITPELAQTDIRKIDADYLEDYAIDLVKRLSLKDHAYDAFKGVINLTYNYAFRKLNKVLTLYNPGKLMDNRLATVLLDQSLETRTAEDVMYTDEEFSRIFETAEKRSRAAQFHGYYIHKYIMTAQYYTGARPGELVALKWTDIDWDNNTIHIHSQQRDTRGKGFVDVQYTKNEKGRSRGGRTIPLYSPLRLALKELQQLQKDKGVPENYIFCQLDGRKIPAKSYESCLCRICKSLGLKSKGTYVFRRFVNAVYIKMGLNENERAQLLGHLPTTNLMCYSQVSIKLIVKVSNMWEQEYAQFHTLHTKSDFTQPSSTLY